MNRKKFLTLLSLPFVVVIIYAIAPSIIQWNIYWMISCIFYIWGLQVARLCYLGFSVYNSLLILVMPFNKHWFKLWQKDPVELNNI